MGPCAWVQGRRATSKVTATSGGRLTNRYAWVPGRPTRRACLGVNLPLRVPCKRYPDEVTELKMAALILLRYRQRRLLRRNRIFLDRTNPLHKFNDLELFWQIRFRRADIRQMTNELKEELEHLPESEGRATSRFHRPENSAESLPTMNINSSSNGLSWTDGSSRGSPFFVCFFLLLFCCCCTVFLSLKKSFLLRCVRSNSRLSS